MIALAGALRSERAAASPEDVLGFGARTTAMGATGAAIAEGYEAVYGNPALLSLARSRELKLGFVGAMFDLRAEQAGSPGVGALGMPGNRVSYEPLHGTLIGATLPIPFGGALKDRVALGFGFFTPTSLVVRGRILYPEKPQFLTADRTQSVAVQAGLGVHVWKGLRVGGGFAALAALQGSVQVATDASGRIGTVVEDTLIASYGPIVGASWDFGDTWRLGLTWRGELVGRFNVVINVRDLGSIVVPPLNISGVAQYDPWQIALEFARVKKPWRAAIGATFKHWSAYPGPAEATVRCPGVEPETSLPTCDVLIPRRPGYHDTVSARAGVERTFEPAPGVGMALRGGLFVEPTPAPALLRSGYLTFGSDGRLVPRGSSNLFDNTRVAFTLGYGLELGPPLPRLSIDLFAQAHWLVARDYGRSVALDEVSGAAPGVTSYGAIIAAGTAVGVKF